MDEQKNQGILGHFGLFSGKRTFSQKNLTLSVLSTYGPSTSCKIWDKSYEPILTKNATIMEKQINRTIFLWSLNFMQNIKETYETILKKCCCNGRTHKSGHFWPFLAHFRAIFENFPKKFDSVSFEYLWSLNFMQNIKKN